MERRNFLKMAAAAVGALFASQVVGQDRTPITGKRYWLIGIDVPTYEWDTVTITLGRLQNGHLYIEGQLERGYQELLDDPHWRPYVEQHLIGGPFYISEQRATELFEDIRLQQRVRANFHRIRQGPRGGAAAAVAIA